MMERTVHTLILGAGTSGLAAGYTLAKAGLAPVLIERDKTCGGLFQSIRRGEFSVDVGRKELYNRIERVDVLWRQLLGADYREYPHRGGILYQGHLIDMSPKFQGLRRGMPLSLLFGCAVDLVSAQLRRRRSASNLEDYYYQRRGRRLTQVFAQGFQEKLTGKKWRDVVVPQDVASDTGGGAVSTFKELLQRAWSKTEVNTFEGIWRHPARGTGQICDLLAKGIEANGGEIHYRSQLQGMTTSADGRIETVTVEHGGACVVYRPAHVVSSIPIELLQRFLRGEAPAAASAAATDGPRRTVILVYMFLNAPPRFPQAWLQVTCPTTRIGRITNYAGFNGDMVPRGKGALCCEYYCFGDDPLLSVSTEDVLRQTQDYCVRAGLMEPGALADQLVLKLPGADASQNRDNWMSPARRRLMAELSAFGNLYYVNRTETDIATLAGIEAAEAIMNGDRRAFDDRVDPGKLHIRSESKAFSFDSPVPVQ
jgi:protoporphyrinogen oxidase